MDIEELRKMLVTCPHCDCRQSFYKESGSVICPNCKKEFYVFKCPSCMSRNIMQGSTTQLKCSNCGNSFDVPANNVNATQKEESNSCDPTFAVPDKILIQEEYIQPFTSYCLKAISFAFFLICAVATTFTEVDFLKASAVIMVICWVIAAYINYKERGRVEENNRQYWIQESERRRNKREEEERKRIEHRKRLLH